MASLNSLTHIRETALHLIDSLASENALEALSARMQLDLLVDRFYQENIDYMSPRQREDAKKDFEYFLILLEAAIERAKREVEKN
jgi:hypothetical protein